MEIALKIVASVLMIAAILLPVAGVLGHFWKKAECWWFYCLMVIYATIALSGLVGLVLAFCVMWGLI
jgi:hypothetical protein